MDTEVAVEVRGVEIGGKGVVGSIFGGMPNYSVIFHVSWYFSSFSHIRSHRPLDISLRSGRKEIDDSLNH